MPDHYQGYPGVVHGGIVAAMLDEVAGRAFMGEDSPRFMFTAKLDIRYRKNVPVGENLRVIGQVLKNKERIAIAKSMIYNQQSEILAEAEVLLVDIPPDTYKDVDLAVLGWKVYPD